MSSRTEKENKTSHKFNDLDDDTIDSLRRYYNVDDSDHKEFLRYIKGSRLITPTED